MSVVFDNASVTKRRWVPDWFDQQARIQRGEEWYELRNDPGAGRLFRSPFSGTGYTRSGPSPRAQQITQGYNHPDWWRYRRKGERPPDDVGGPFESLRYWVRSVNPTVRTVRGRKAFSQTYDQLGEFTGNLYAVRPDSLGLPSLEERNLDPIGATAISRCKPTNSVAELSNFLAELYSEGLPKLIGTSLWKERTLQARDAGEEYLNQEFGWKPLVGDVQSIMNALAQSQLFIEQYEAGSHQETRRRYSFPLEETRSETLYSTSGGVQFSPYTYNVVGADASSQPVYVLSKFYRRTWFSGSFTYHLPTGWNSRNALVSLGTRASTLLGLDLTPEVIWNAAPWSWAVDWFSNAGDVISNLSDWADDGLVLKYGYIMEHSMKSDTYFLTSSGGLLDHSLTPSPVESYIERKRRREATPYGFGVDWDSFDPRKLSIISALGLTRR